MQNSSIRSIQNQAFSAGTNNSSFNSRSVSWQKVKRIKARVAKKRSGTKEKHSKAVEAASGKRTKKSQRKAERRARLQAKELEAMQNSMEVDKITTSSKSKKNKKNNAGRATPMQD